MNENWLEVLNEYDVQWLVLDPQEDRNLVDLCRSRPDWEIHFEDGEAIIFRNLQDLHASGDHSTKKIK